MLHLSPPVGIKYIQISGAQKTYIWEEDKIEELPWYNLDNPLWETSFLTTQALFNVPLDRLYTKVNNIREAINAENQAWQRIALMMGWTKWNLGIKEGEKKSKKKKSGKKKKLILR